MVLANVYKSAGDITAEMRRSSADWDGTLNLINLGFWPEDRDGNPFVSVETTKKVADRLRDVLQCYYQDYAVSDAEFPSTVYMKTSWRLKSKYFVASVTRRIGTLFRSGALRGGVQI